MGDDFINSEECLFVPPSKARHGAFYCASLVEKYVKGVQGSRPIPRIDEECSEARTGYSVSWCSNFMKAIMNHLSQQECLMKWTEFCGKGRRLMQTLAVVASENSMKEKAAPILKHFIDPDIVKVIVNIWELMTALTKDIDCQPGSNVVGPEQNVGDVYRYFHERHGPARMRAESASLTLWLEKSEKRFTAFRDAYWIQTYCAPKARVCAVVNGVLDKDEVRRNHEYVQKHLELLAISAKYVAFAARREPLCTAKNILELTITGKIKMIPTIPDALYAASIAMGRVLFLHARLRKIFGGNDRERMGYVGGDKTIIKDVDEQLNNRNKIFPVMAKAWESKLPAINMCAISVAPRGEDRAQEEANRLTWESFIVLQESKTADEQQHRAFINNLLYSRDGSKKFVDILNEDFGEEEVPAWWRISGETPPVPEPKATPKPSAGSEQPGAQPSACSSDDPAGRAPWWSTWRPPGKDQDDGTVVNATIQAILEICAKGEDERWIMPEKHTANESVTVIRQPQHWG